MNRCEAYISKQWLEQGLAHVLVLRTKADGLVDLGAFVVDIWCLGVKDAYGESGITESELRELLDARLPESERESILPACAKKLVEGAVAYAERLGFAPQRDYRKARRVLSAIDASHCATEFTYGRDGRPCYVQGADESERVDRVLAILEARVGPDGFDFELTDEDDDADMLEVRAELIQWLDDEPDDVPRFYALSGMITALHLSPTPESPLRLLELLWPEDHIWVEGDLEEFTDLLMNYWNYVGDLVQTAIAPGAPPEERAIDVWPEDFPEDDAMPLLAATAEWAAGFLRVTQIWADAWDDALKQPTLAPHWEVLRWWAEVSKENLDRIADAAEAPEPRTIAASVRTIARALRPPSHPPSDARD